MFLAASPLTAVPPCYFRFYFKYWDTAKCVCVQLQVSVLGVTATELCVHLQETADEAPKKRWLAISQQRFVRGFCVTRCSCWQGSDSRHQHTGHGTTWDMMQAVASMTSCSKAEEKSPWRTSKQQPIHQPPHTQKREPQACWVFGGMGFCYESSS